MKTLLLGSPLLLGVSSQYESWSCNHFAYYTVNQCYQYSPPYQVMYECNGTDQMISYHYTDGSCGTSDPQHDTVSIYDESSDTTDLFKCDQVEPCDYAIIRYYVDEDCEDDDSYFDLARILHECYAGDTTSLMFSCSSGNVLTLREFSDENDCTGSYQTINYDYDEETDGIEGCYEVCI